MYATRFLLALACAPALCAQGTISPDHFAIAEGNNTVAVGLGEATAPTRYLEIHTLPMPQTIGSIAVRRDSTAQGQYPGGSWVADLWISTAAVGPGQIDKRFAMNHGADKVQVGTSATYSFPTTVPGSLPQAFDYKLPFSQPFTFPGNVNGVCWEVQIQARNQAGQMLFDGAGNWSANPPGEVWEGGVGCTATGYATGAHITGLPIPDWLASTLQISWTASNLPKGGAGLLSIGTTDKVFAGIPLPFTLPGTAGAPSGPCTLYNDAALLMPVPIDPQGQINVVANGWLFPGLHGFSLFAQAIAVDAQANSLGVVLTNTVQQHLIEPWSTILNAHVYLSNSLGASGTSVQYQALVVKFE